MTKEIIIAILIGYAFGVIQTAYLLSKSAGKMDIREYGSGNAGASNMTTIMGWKYGVIVATVDILKGLFAVLVVKWIYPHDPNLAYLSGIMAIIGHIFPFYMKFQGGKGVATLIGVLGGIDLKLGVLFGLLVIIPAFITDYIVAGSLTVFIALPVTTYLLGYPTVFVWLGAGITILAFWLHRSNIQRILNGDELKIRSVLKRKISDE